MDSSHHGAKATACVTQYLDLPPSCLQISPHHSDFFAVGTYKLEEAETVTSDAEAVQQKRSGSVALYQVKDDTDLHLLSSISTPFAVLDLQFCPNDGSVLAVAASTGHIELLILQYESTISIRKLRSFKIDEPDILVLSLRWISETQSSSGHHGAMLFSLSSGDTGILRWREDAHQIEKINAHSLEAWTAVGSRISNQRESLSWYTGGDDSVLCKVRTLSTVPALAAERDKVTTNLIIAAFDSKTHGAGVTAILSLGSQRGVNSGGRSIEYDNQEVIVTGSYDEYVRILTLKDGARRATLLADCRLDGGVWQLRKIPSLPRQSHNDDEHESTDDARSIFVLASCMHAGSRVLQIHSTVAGAWSINVVAKFTEHESMNYASDSLLHASPDCSRLLFLSTSFYDRRLCAWHITGL